MTSLQELLGKRRIFELLEVVDENRSINLMRLPGMGWNIVTAAGYLRLLVKHDLLSCTVEGGLGENVKKVYRLTSKGSKVLEHLREIQKLLESGRLGNK
jgi:predicted transcriptional regulator